MYEHRPWQSVLVLVLGRPLVLLPRRILTLRRLGLASGLANPHDGHLRRVHGAVVVASMRRDEHVERARDDEPDRDDDHDDVGDGEGEDVQRILALLVERRVGKRRDDGQDGARDVAQHRRPEDGQLPVLACGDDGVEVACKLIALETKSKLALGQYSCVRGSWKK